MKRTELLQEIRKMRFVDSYDKYCTGKLTQDEASDLLGVSSRTFRRYIQRYQEAGEEGLLDKRMVKASHRAAPVDEVCRLEDLYRNEYHGWNVKHFHNWYRKEGGTRSYSWVKNKLQTSGLVKKSTQKGKHRKRRERSPMEGMLIHQDGSTHQWINGVYWDLIVTMDDATSEHYSMFFVEQEGTQSSFKGVMEVIQNKGLFCNFYSDRGSHYWYTPEAGGKVSKTELTQFGRAMNQLGINMIAAYSPEARGRSERAFATHQGRLPHELAKQGIKTIGDANKYLKDVYLPAWNNEFTVKPSEQSSAFIPCAMEQAHEILCEHYERTVGKDNCISFEGLRLQIPQQAYRLNFAKAKVRVHRYVNNELAIFYGPRLLARYTYKGELITEKKDVA
jgi:transposase